MRISAGCLDRWGNRGRLVSPLGVAAPVTCRTSRRGKERCGSFSKRSRCHRYSRDNSPRPSRRMENSTGEEAARALPFSRIALVLSQRPRPRNARWRKPMRNFEWPRAHCVITKWRSIKTRLAATRRLRVCSWEKIRAALGICPPLCTSIRKAN